MALKATIFKAQLQIADIDRNVYLDHAVTIARHPSENDERMMMRLLALALNIPADDHNGQLDLGKGLSDVDEPDLAHADLTGRILHWIELGQPDDKRLQRASSKSDEVTVYSYANSTPVWWAGIENKLGRLGKVAVWQIPADQSQELSRLAERSMRWQVTVQDGTCYVNTGKDTVEITPRLLRARAG
ncbi:MAG: YaeQ family protein [Burkholderiales bacterium]|nr:YaeQ family protein [Burkholderiales bacterium]